MTIQAVRNILVMYSDVIIEVVVLALNTMSKSVKAVQSMWV